MSNDESRVEEIADFFNEVAPDYEAMHLSHVQKGMESKRDMADHIPQGTKRLLDLGAGTGLDLEEVIKRFPDIDITVVDIAQDMLERLVERFPGTKINVIVSDYFTGDLGTGPYDVVMSSMTMHHWLPEDKTKLYRRVYEVLRPGGIYIDNDYMITEGTPEEAAAEEQRGLNERRRLMQENPGIAHVHMDNPLTVDSEMKVLRDAGFGNVEEVWRGVNNVTLVSQKQG